VKLARAVVLFALIVSCPVVFAACGGGGSSSSSSSSEPAEESGGSAAEESGGSGEAETTADESGGGSSDPVVAEAEEAVKVAEAPISEFKGPKSTPPIEPGKKVYVIDCSPETEGCQRLDESSMEGIKAIGWDGTLIHSDGSVPSFNSGIRQAINAGAEGIILSAIPTSVVAAPVKAAEEAGIPVVTTVAGEPEPKIGPEFKGGYYTNVDANNEELGKIAADWVIDQTQGEAEVGAFISPEFPVLVTRLESFEKELEKCSSCSMNGSSPVKVTGNTLIKDGPSNVTEFLRANPDVNYFFSAWDGGAAVAAQGIKASGTEVPMVSQEGNAPNLEMIREGGPEVAAVGTPLEWDGWAAVDQMNRAFNHEQPAPEWMPTGHGIPFQLLNEGNVPSTKTFTGELEYQKEFEKLWGV
jgi:ribose transport system substrate-binding protein